MFTNVQSHNFPVTKNPKYPRGYKVFLEEDDEKYYDAQVFFCESSIVEVAIIGVFEDSLSSVFIQAAESGFSTNLRDKLQSCFNVFSAMLSVRIAKLALPANISIITPFRAQAGLINALLDDEGIKDKVVVSTVHRFQGHESDIVVFDSVESFGKDRHLDSIFVGGNEEEQFPGRLINVASTRARGKLIVIADMQYLGQPTNSVEVQEVVNFMIRFGKKNCVFGEELKAFCIQHNDISEFKMFANDVPNLDYEKRSAESVELHKGVFLFGNRDDSDYSLKRRTCKCVSKGKALYDWIMKNTL